MIDTIRLWMVYELVMSLAVWPFLVGIFLIVGSRQSREGQGTTKRLIRVSIIAATLASLPMLIWLVVLLPPYSVETSFIFSLALTALSAVGVCRYLTSEPRIRGGANRLPIVQDLEFTGRARELSALMGIDPPCIRLLDSAPDSQVTTVHVGGLPAPTVVISSRVIEQLSIEERDSVLSHALAHIAAGSLWWYASLVPMATVAASCSSSFVATWLALAIGIAYFFVAKWSCDLWFAARRREIVADVLERTDILASGDAAQ